MPSGIPTSGTLSSLVKGPYCEENQGIVGLVFTWILLAVGMIVISLRFYVRLSLRKSVGWDDYTAIISLVRIPRLTSFLYLAVPAKCRIVTPYLSAFSGGWYCCRWTFYKDDNLGHGQARLMPPSRVPHLYARIQRHL